MHRAIFVCLCLLALSAAAQEGGCTAPPNGLAAWWTFDETSATVAADRAGSVKNDGTHQGSVTPMSGTVAGAACYDGKSGTTVVPDQDEIDFESHCEVDAGTAFTIDFWIRTDSYTGTHSILDKREYDASTSTLKGYHVYLYKGRIGFQMANGTGPLYCAAGGVCTNFTSPFTIAGTGWHFVAITVIQGCRTNSATFYVDGQESQFTPPAYNLANSAPLYIARRAPSLGGQYFRGCIDELEIIKTALTKSQLDAIYAAGPYGKCKSKCPVELPPVLAGCLGECGNDPISTQFVVINSGASTACAGGCKLRVKLIEPEELCPNHGVHLVIRKNGTTVIWDKVYVNDFLGVGSGYIDVVLPDSIDPNDLISIKATLEAIPDPDSVCKRLGNMSFEVTILQ